MRPRHRWLHELTHLPTTSGREEQVVAWVESWVDRRPELRMRADAAGNLLLTVKGRKRHEPVIATAHMDHPGWVVTEVIDRSVSARFMGGVRPEYFPGARVVFFAGDGTEVVGRVSGMQRQMGTIGLDRATSVLSPGDIGRWRFDKRTLGIRGDRLRAPGCDDLAGVAAALVALDRARKDPKLSHFGVLLTRAEEEGLLGAIAACELETIPAGSRLLSIETSRASSDAPIGSGPIVRVGDRSSVFDAALTNQVTNVVRASGLPHQRKLMSGGSCEATAFGAYGLRSTGLCLALGNYHNMGDLDGVEAGVATPTLAPEEISLADFDGLVELMVRTARDIDASEDQIRSRLAANYESRRGLLGL